MGMLPFISDKIATLPLSWAEKVKIDRSSVPCDTLIKYLEGSLSLADRTCLKTAEMRSHLGQRVQAIAQEVKLATSQLERILEDWISESPQEVGRQEAKNRVLSLVQSGETALHLENLEIASLPDRLFGQLAGMCALKELHLEGNRLRDIPQQIFLHSSLDRVVLDNNPLSPECALRVFLFDKSRTGVLFAPTLFPVMQKMDQEDWQYGYKGIVKCFKGIEDSQDQAGILKCISAQNTESILFEDLAEILDAIENLPVYERADICQCALLCMQDTTDVHQRIDIIQAIARIPAHTRLPLCRRALPYLKGIADGNTALFLYSIDEVAESRWKETYQEVLELVTSLREERNRDPYQTIVNMPAQERAALCRSIRLFVQNIKAHRSSYVVLIYNMPPSLWQEFRDMVDKITEGLKHDTYGRVARAILNIPVSQRMEFCRNVCSLTQGIAVADKAEILFTLSDLAETSRQLICKQITGSGEPLVCNRKVLLYFLRYVPPQYIDKAISFFLKEKIRQDLGIGGAMEVVVSMIKRYPDLKEEFYQYLFHELGSLKDIFEAKLLAMSILQRRRQLSLSEDHPLIQRAIYIELATEYRAESEPKNPYGLYTKLQRMRKNPTPEIVLKLSPTSVQGIFAACLPEALAEKPQGITKDQLPDIHEATPEKLFERLDARLQSLDDPTRQAVERRIQEITLASLKELRGDFGQDLYLKGLLTSPVSLQQAYFYAILNFIATQPATLQSPSDLLTPQEEALLGMAASIRYCNVGKSEGIVLAYNRLDPKYKYNTSAIAHGEASVCITTLVRNVITDTILSLLSNNNSMMRKMTNSQDPVQQLAHQSLYLKNLIADRIGLPHELQFDLHTHMLYTSLIEKDLLTVLHIFYEYCTPDLLADALVLAYNASSESGGALMRGIDALFGAAGAQLLQYDAAEETMSLTKAGALRLLAKTGYICIRQDVPS